ncbi:TPA: hypothetical protein GE480_09455 [Escherichia coli]|nr:hypothetical protein [Escherichia coli]
MPKLTDMQIRAWIKAGDRFDGKADGNGLYICYPKNYTVPFWRFRYIHFVTNAISSGIRIDKINRTMIHF